MSQTQHIVTVSHTQGDWGVQEGGILKLGDSNWDRVRVFHCNNGWKIDTRTLLKQKFQGMLSLCIVT